jgi:diadenosine tetraphosphate (Ap4A) HIT family hydrolase
MSECVFCQIVRGEAPCRKVHEDEHTLAFLDLYPITPGHSLVIPKPHIVWYTDLTLAQAGPFSRAVYLVARKLKQALSAEYVSIAIRGTRVPHLHALLVPKLPGQDNLFDRTMNLHHFAQERLRPVADAAELDRIAERIRDCRPA